MTNLGQLEAAVMERLWATDGPMTVRQVLTDLQRDRPLAYTTVMTVLDNLHRKGMVLREKSGRAYVYRSRESRAVYIADLMSEALSSTKDRRSALLHFVEGMSAAEIKALRLALDGKADERGVGRSRGRGSRR